MALRRRRGDLSAVERALVSEWAELVTEGRAVLLGLVRQEVLSGIAAAPQFERLRQYLQDFDDLPCSRQDHEQAARLFNQLRAAGITGGPIDLVICAVALRERIAIFTTDPDFTGYGRHLPIQLHAPRRTSV